MSRDDVLDAVRRQRIVGIVRRADADDAYRAARQLLDAGLAVVEVSLTTPDAADVIGRLAVDVPAGAVVGAGTVLTVTDVGRVADAGATFVVSPVLDPSILVAARSRGLVTVPAAFTPTEMVDALRAGADLVKLFPASAWTAGALRDVLTALPDLPLVPTGGIGLADAADWIGAGAVAVGLGSALAGVTPDELSQLIALF